MKNSTPFSYLPPFTGTSWITLVPDLCSPTYKKLAKGSKANFRVSIQPSPPLTPSAMAHQWPL